MLALLAIMAQIVNIISMIARSTVVITMELALMELAAIDVHANKVLTERIVRITSMNAC